MPFRDWPESEKDMSREGNRLVSMRSSVDVRHELVKMYTVDDVEHFLSSVQCRELLRLTSYLEPERSKT